MTKEEIILQKVKRTLTQIIKDTATPPELVHPLSEATIYSLRDCLCLISEREKEILEASGKTNKMRPRYVDEPEKQKNVVIPLESSGLVNKKTDKDQ